MRFKKIILGILSLLAGFMTTVMITLAIILVAPQLIVNKKSLEWASSIAPHFGVKLESLDWQDVRIQVSSISLFKKHFDLSFSDFCFSYSTNIQGCMDNADIHFTAGLEGFHFSFQEFGPISIEARSLDVSLISHPPKKNQKFELSLPDIVFPSFLNDTLFKPISLKIESIQIIQGEKKYRGRAVLSSLQDSEALLEGLNLESQFEEIFGFKEPVLKASLKSFSHFKEKDWVLEASVDSLLNKISEKKSEIHLDLKGVYEKDNDISYAINARLSQDKIDSFVETKGRFENAQISGDIRAQASGFSKEVNRVSIKDCHYSYIQREKLQDKGRLNLHCPLHVDLSPLKLPSATFSKIITLPYNLDFMVETDLDTSLTPSMDAPLAGKMKIVLSPLTQDLLNVKGEVIAHFSGIPSQYPMSWKTETNVDFSLIVPDFRKVVKALRKTAFAVPAPFAVLKGDIELSLKGQADIAQGNGKIPIELKTRLKSKQESLDTEGKGNISYRFLPDLLSPKESRKGPKLEFELELSKVKITLPNFAVASLPLLFMDKRIREPSDFLNERQKNAFHYRIRVFNTENPIELTSNIARGPVPVYLDVSLEPGVLQGHVNIAESQLHFFNQNATLQEMKITLKDPAENSDIAARFHVNYENYKIDVYILGTLNKPQFVFESVPPLSESELISILLYGEPFQDLDATQSSSVSDASAAFSQSVIGLGSFLLLASTPIKSIAYNPATGAFSATLSLGKGTLLKVATQENKQQVGLRKSLSGNWSINTYLENDKESQKQTGVTFFEWVKRY